MPRPKKDIKEHTPLMQVRVAKERQDDYRAKADSQGMDLSAWVRKTLDRALRRKNS